MVPVATLGQPSSLGGQKAQIAQLQTQLNSINTQAEAATNNYDGAMWQLQNAKQQIATNTAAITANTKRLEASKAVLGARLRQIYANPQPDAIQVLLSSGNITAMSDTSSLVQHIGKQDASVVTGVRGSLTHLTQARTGLVVAQQAARAQVAAAAQQRTKILGLLNQQQQVLAHAQAGLRAQIAAQAAAEARAAALQRTQALAAQRSQQAQTNAPVSSTAPPGASASGPSSTSSGGGGTSSVSIPSGSGNAAAVAVAERYLGVPYVWGGASPSGFDCSGLMYYAYKQIGKYVPHYTVAEWNAFPHVPLNQLQPGDLVFFGGLGHVGMYIGGGQMIHAPHTGTVVQISSLSSMGSAPDGAVRP
jgi:cell wall-associated NlpC family hydrolase